MEILFSNGSDKVGFGMRSLNLDQLRTFVEVAALGNFSAAGRRLNLTQPAVSLHVRELEQRLGVRLIERSGRQARATAPGRELAVQAQQIFAACDAAEAAMRRERPTPTRKRWRLRRRFRPERRITSPRQATSVSRMSCCS